MSRPWTNGAVWLGAILSAILAPAHVHAQGSVPVFNMTPPVVGPSNEPIPADFESAVSFLDSAIPRSSLRLRFDVDYVNRRPTRAEFLFPADGFAQPEPRVHLQELNTFVEYGLNEWFSTFMETPLRWVNPQVNDNVFGLGDLSFGAKFAFWNTGDLMTTFQLRFSANTSQHTLTGTGHWSVEPALLVNYRLLDMFTLEGQVGYWVPMGGTDFAGDVLRYGLGVSYGAKSIGNVMLVPVAEVVGWTATSGQSLVVDGPGLFHVESAAGDTILNGCLGLRFTLGGNADIYAGYSRCFTGPSWFRDQARIEFRLFY